MKLTSTYKTQKYCVDVPGGLRKNNLQTIVYPCHNGPNQKFHYNRRTKTLRNVATRKCLTADKGRIVQKRCGKNKTQKFERRGKHWVSLASKNSKTRCLDVEGGRYGDNKNPGKLIAFSCHSGPNQQFNSA
jgi:hypothetical protein